MNSSIEASQVHNCSLYGEKTQMPQWQPSFLTSEMSASLIAITIVNSLVLSFSILLNVLVIIAVTKTNQLRNKYNALLACLAGTDLLTAAFGHPSVIAKQISRLTSFLESYYCNIEYIGSLMYGPFVIASLQQLVLISMERYIAIKYPYEYDAIFTKHRLIGGVVTAWFFALSPHLISLFLKSSGVFFVIFRAFTLIPSFCVLVFCHIAVYYEARDQMRKIKTQELSPEAKETFLKENKALKTTNILLGSALAAYLPMMFFRTVLARSITSPLASFTLEAAFLSLAICNSVWNPLIYCARSRVYRAAFKKLLGLQRYQVHHVGAPN